LPSNSEIPASDVVNRILSEGLFISKDALDLLRKSASKDVYERAVISAIQMARQERANTVELRHVMAAMSVSKGEVVEVGVKAREALGKEIEPEVEVMYSPRDTMPMSDSVSSRVDYFQSRFRQLQRILMSRPDFNSPVPVGEISKMNSQASFKTIAMILRKDNRRLEVEDLKDSATLYMPKNPSPELEEKLSYLVVDMVVGLELRKFQGVVFINDVVLPDVPDTPPKKTRDAIVTLLLSDLHVGSQYYLEKEFAKLAEWLSGRIGTASSQSIANAVKYVIVAGDIVDGVFVYPKQERELKIVSLEKQYEEALKALYRLPEYIHLIIGPGNHDVVRDAIPQPPIPKEFLGDFVTERGNATIVGNPAQVSLHQVRFLIYHGQSLEDIVASVPGIEYSRPHDGMKFLLRARHLAPIYGGNTQICTEGEDDLTIPFKPEVFHAGHVHVAGITSYRGTQIVNSGTWQGKTSYQQNLGIEPTTASLGVHFMKDGISRLMFLKDLV